MINFNDDDFEKNLAIQKFRLMNLVEFIFNDLSYLSSDPISIDFYRREYNGNKGFDNPFTKFAYIIGLGNDDYKFNNYLNLDHNSNKGFIIQEKKGNLEIIRKPKFYELILKALQFYYDFINGLSIKIHTHELEIDSQRGFFIQELKSLVDYFNYEIDHNGYNHVFVEK